MTTKRKLLNAQIVNADNDITIYQHGQACLNVSQIEAKNLINQLRKLTKITTSKYNNEKIFAYDRQWDSKAELEFYEFLLQSNYQFNIEIQPKFILQEKLNKIREISYVADFAVGDLVYDVKGFLTPDFKLKAKLFKHKYSTKKLVLITKTPLWLQHTYGAWITLEDLTKERKIKNKLTKTANK